MNDFIASLYEKIKLSENIYVFKRIGLIEDAFIELTNDLNELTYYDENEKRVTVGYMEDEYEVISDEKYCYGYPIVKEDLESLYPDLNEVELRAKYLDEISEVLNIAYYDEETDSIKIVVSNEEQLKKADSDELFNFISVQYDSDDYTVNVRLKDLNKIIKLAIDDKNKEVKENLLKLNKGIKKSNEIASTLLQKPVEEKHEETLEEILEELNSLIGLDNIKKEINKLKLFLEFKNKGDKYLNLEPPYLHMFFIGNPGTGKTTVARILGKLFYKMGCLKNDKFAEVTPKDFIAEYVGQTAIKAAKLMKKYEGGVIFIDEAYTFASNAQEFGDEALAEILKELEKKNTIFIFAGYKDEMKSFMDMNPGLVSRIGYYLDYEDYKEEELYQIFERKMNKMGFIITDELKDKVIENIKKAKLNKHFGNGRYIDKLIEKIELEHAVNVEQYKQKKKLITLTESDFNDEIGESLIFKVKTKHLGF